jgi:hypothetical protein
MGTIACHSTCIIGGLELWKLIEQIIIKNPSISSGGDGVIRNLWFVWTPTTEQMRIISSFLQVWVFKIQNFKLAGPSCGNIVSLTPTEWHITKEKQISSLMQKLIAFFSVSAFIIYLRASVFSSNRTTQPKIRTKKWANTYILGENKSVAYNPKYQTFISVKFFVNHSPSCFAHFQFSS